MNSSTRRVRVTAVLSAFLIGGVVSAPAGAQTPDNLSVQQFSPAPGGELNYMHVEGSHTLGHLRPSLGMSVNHAYQPLVLANDTTGEVIPLLQHQTQLDLVGAIGLGDQLQFGVALPVTVHQTAGDEPLRELNATAMGDVRLIPKLNLLNSGKGIQLAVASAVSLPTGDSEELQGEDGPTVEPRAILEYHFTERLRGGVNAGYRMRKTGDFRGLPLGNEVTYGAGMAYDVSPEFFTLVAESYGRAAADPDTRLNVDTLPLEATLGGRFKPSRGHSISIGTGPGVTEGYGSPTWRTYFAYALTDQGPADKDGDGIFDNEDRCPTEPEDRDGFEDLDGCPDVDNDRDGLWDNVDRCPDVAEDPDGWQDDDGCPDPDNDGDRIADVVDACPLKPEVYNGLDDADGCPDDLPRVVETDNVKVTGGKVVILQKVHFDVDKARIKDISWGILDEVAHVLVGNPHLTRVRVEGHTDSDGGADYNLNLSSNRAQAVKLYLVGRGVAAERLEAQGFGEGVPVVANDGRHNKAINRRVEFTIVQQAEAPEGAPAVEVTP